ncbi:glycosyltransferase [Marinitenerispora sediminis]|uniref:Glycosyl transferase n=1 Tax=Marinitenerispora sediminis TaxID=1931232 RepID=A0A368T9I4_9ACTN|nr:glycosyltransferase [Marinitenerispora sediminis]RCV49062.1 glycosyl transferase [Marinitenerispora sediminis]RCV51774.1 glycosyl transferase [Marinitenerispora sediminis]RCV59241.1 glycosyl transferase [Marinitenerispora sediminis]
MRIVLTAQPAYSHLVPLVLPVAELARRAGHEVAVATGPAVAGHVERAGFPALVVPDALTAGEVMRDPSVMGAARPAPPGRATTGVTPEMFGRGFVEVMGGRFAHGLLDVLAGWKPELLLRESTEFGGYLAAERLGLAHGTLDIAPMAPLAHPLVLDQLNAARRRLGLAAVEDPWHPLRGFRAAVVPEEFYPPAARLAGARYYRAPAPAVDEPLDAAIAELPGDRPLVLASLGSNAPRMLGERPALLDAIITALAELPVTAVVALGADRDPAAWPGARAANVHLTSFVQQRALLPACDVFVTHGGFNGVRESLAAGTPMVVLPIFAEQPANADRVAELGAGLRLDIERAASGALRDAVERVRTDPRFRARAGRLQRAALALPPLDRIVEDAPALLG